LKIRNSKFKSVFSNSFVVEEALSGSESNFEFRILNFQWHQLLFN